MFKTLNEDDGEGGFVNEGLEHDEESGRREAKQTHDSSTSPATTIQISRSKYDQRKLYDEMLYKKSSSKSSK